MFDRNYGGITMEENIRQPYWKDQDINPDPLPLVYTIYNNSYVLEQVLTLAKSYGQWCSCDYKEIQKELKEIHNKEKPGVVVKHFNEIFKNYCHLTFL